MLICAARRAARILFRTDDLPAARARPAARVKLVAFQVGLGEQLLFGFPDLLRGLDAGVVNVYPFGRVVGPWRRVFLHR